MTDLVIGAISGYGFEDVRCWANSLERSGFAGDRIVIAYSADFDTVEALVDRGFCVVTYAEDGRRRRFHYPVKGFRHEDVSIDRFHQIWRVLSEGPEYRYLIASDVRDVIFQRNPGVWLEENLGDKQITVGSEGLRVADEPWQSEVVLESYGRSVYELVAGRTAWNAGTLAGRFGIMRDLALNVFLCSRLNPISYTDQPALNILLALEPYRSMTRFNRAEDDWACQAATVADPEYRDARGSALLAPPPVLDGDRVRTPEGELYCIVHQYDRIPEWAARLRRRYSDRADERSTTR